MADRKMVQVEMLVAYDNRTWDTVFVDVPVEVVYDDEHGTDREAVVVWAEKHLSVQAQYRRVVCWQLYSISEDQFQDTDADE